LEFFRKQVKQTLKKIVFFCVNKYSPNLSAVTYGQRGRLIQEGFLILQRKAL